jgi:cation diffusion facilitator CzcD-associated flavoprotein CzcO
VNGKSQNCHVAVVGAGPYGLSSASYLRAAGVETRFFGEPMAFWQHQMPKSSHPSASWWRLESTISPIAQRSLLGFPLNWARIRVNTMICGNSKADAWSSSVQARARLNRLPCLRKRALRLRLSHGIRVSQLGGLASEATLLGYDLQNALLDAECRPGRN